MNDFKIYKDEFDYYIILDEKIFCSNKNCEDDLNYSCIFTVSLDRNKKNEIKLYCPKCMKRITDKSEIQFKNIALIKNYIPANSKPVIFNKIGLINVNNNISVFEAVELKTERTIDKTKYKNDSFENAIIGKSESELLLEDDKKEIELKNKGVIQFLKEYKENNMIENGTTKQIT